MVDFTLFLLVLRFLIEFIEENSQYLSTIYIVLGGMAIALAIAFITIPKDRPVRTSVFAGLRWILIIFGFSAVVFGWPHVSGWVAGQLGLDAEMLSVYSIGVVIFLICTSSFVASRFFPNIPRNNSLSNTRQVLSWCGYISLAIFLFYVLYYVNFGFFFNFIAIIFVIAELFCILIWLYDPFIFMYSKLFPKKKQNLPREATLGKLNRFAIIGCAHNEEKVINQLIKSLYAMEYPKNKYDIYVVCDNCTDDTAKVVKRAGAIAMERTVLEHRGKGFALKWMFDYLDKQRDEGNSYDAYIVLDADNLVNKEFLYYVNEKLNNGHEILQTYLGCKNPRDTWISASYSYAYWVSNALYQNGHSNAGLSAQMGGTGMVIRPSVLEEVGWETDSLTEDLVLTTRYVSEKNLACGWVHEAVLYDEKPLKTILSIRQRTRWMQGHMAAMFKFAPSLFWKGLRNMSLKQMDVSFYLLRPFLNLMIFATYLARVFFNVFMSDTMALGYIVSVEATMLLLLGNLTLQLCILFSEQLGRYFPLLVLQLVFSFTWYPAIFRGLIKRNERYWLSTEHTRDISIEEVGDDILLTEAREALLGVDNIHHMPIGLMLLQSKTITQSQLDSALEYQSEHGGRLGDIITEMNIVPKEKLEAFLSVQHTERELMAQEGRPTESLLLGTILVEAGAITQQQLDMALEHQRKNGGLLGESLIATRCLPSTLMGIFLEVQKLFDVNYLSVDQSTELVDGVLSNSSESFGTILWHAGLVSKQQLDYALDLQKEQGGLVGDILVERGFINEDILTVVLAVQEYGRQYLESLALEDGAEEAGGAGAAGGAGEASEAAGDKTSGESEEADGAEVSKELEEAEGGGTDG